jgi:hypothetical protein
MGAAAGYHSHTSRERVTALGIDCVAADLGWTDCGYVPGKFFRITSEMAGL